MVNPVLSIIIPWFKKLKYFKASLPQNRLYVDPRVELVIPMDEPSEELELMELLRAHPNVKARVIVNDARKDCTDWRPPCKAINVGIRNSLGIYTAVLSPETIVCPPTNEYLFRKLASFSNSRFFLTGSLYNIELSEREFHYDPYLLCEVLECRRAELKEFPMEAYGWFITPTKILTELRGFDESRLKYGGDDDCMRVRMRMFGCQEQADINLRLTHLWHRDTKREFGHEPYGEKVVLWAQDKTWGRDYSRIALDYAKP